MKKYVLLLLGIVCALHATHAENDTLGVSPFSGKPRFLEENLHTTIEATNAFPTFSPERFSTVSFVDTEGKKRRPTILRFIVPTLCLAYGTAARFNEGPVRRFDKHIAGQVNKHIDRHYGIDNSLLIMPAAVAWGLDFVPGVKARHNFRDRTGYVVHHYVCISLHDKRPDERRASPSMGRIQLFPVRAYGDSFHGSAYSVQGIS